MMSLFRIAIVCVALGGVVLAVFWNVGTRRHERAIDELEALNEEMNARLEARQAMVNRLSRTRRVAHVHVLEQTIDSAGDVESTTVLFIEMDDDGRELGRQEFTLPGDVMTIDAWTVKFDFEEIADGHPMRGRTLILLRRMYSDQMPAIEGYAIDTPGGIPPAYAAADISRFEQQVWEHFWHLATNADAADEFGVRVAQGEAVYKPVRAGQAYELQVDTAGGLNLMPLSTSTLATGHAD